MQYWGKLLGFTMGYLSGAGFWAIVLGLLLGHALDVSRHSRRYGFSTLQQARQTRFFTTTFQVMGHISKAKGRVTERDIQVASLFMDRLQLHGQARVAAQQAFQQGKVPAYPLREQLKQFRRLCFGRNDLLRTFLEIQLQTAFADGQLHPRERQVLYVIGEELGVSRQRLDRYLSMIEGGQSFQAGSQGQPRGPTLHDACNVLGVSASDEPAVIKRAYRKLMSEHHPDKLVAKGLPPEMMAMAKQKTQEIQAAYDLIKKEKGFK